jgi:hypothetical protein
MLTINNNYRQGLLPEGTIKMHNDKLTGVISLGKTGKYRLVLTTLDSKRKVTILPELSEEEINLIILLYSLQKEVVEAINENH